MRYSTVVVAWGALVFALALVFSYFLARELVRNALRSGPVTHVMSIVRAPGERLAALIYRGSSRKPAAQQGAPCQQLGANRSGDSRPRAA